MATVIVPAHAQRWQWLLGNGEQDFRKISAAFYKERDSLLDVLKANPSLRQMPKLTVWEEASKRVRYKQYYRIEELYKPRMDANGVYDPTATYNTYQRWKQNTQPLQRPQTANGTPLGNSPSWTNFGPTSTPPFANLKLQQGMGRVASIAFDPSNASVFYVSSASGGLWKTTNGGTSYTPLIDFMTSSVQAGDVVVDSNNPSTLYVATSVPYMWTAGTGIWKSTNGGSTWTQIGLNGTRIEHLVMEPGSSTHLWACTDAGLYESTNSGSTWSLLSSSVLPSGQVQCLHYQPRSKTNIFLSIKVSGATYFYKSLNNGASWASVTLPQAASNINRIEFAMTPADSQYIYLAAICTNSDNHAIYKSTDASATWTTIADTGTAIKYQDGTSISNKFFAYLFPYANVVAPIAVAPTDRDEVYVGFVYMGQTTDGGTTWKDYTTDANGGTNNVHHNDHVDIKWGPVDGKLYIACDGGIFRRTGGPGTTVSDINGNMGITENYAIETSYDGTKFACGNQDNGTFLYNGSAWKHVASGDGMTCHFDKGNNNIFYASPQVGLSIQKYTNGAANGGEQAGDANNIFSQSLAGGQAASWITQYVLHPVDRNIIYAAYVDVFKTTDGGRTWTNLTNGSVGTSSKRLLRISQANPNMLVMADDVGTGYWKSTDGGATWASMSALNGTYYSDICLHPSDSTVMWVCNWGTVKKSTNGGTSFSAYSANTGTGSIPSIMANCLAYQDGTNPVLYLGMDLGVYEHHDNASGWTLFTNNDLPNVIVSSIEVVPATSKLRVGTKQRGMWETTLAETFSGCYQSSVPVLASSICNGTTMLTSSTAPTSWGYQWFKNGDAISGATSQTYTITTSGNYAVAFQNGTCLSPASETRSFNMSLPSLPTSGSGCTALAFDGNDDNITVKHSNSLMLGNDFSIEFWLKMGTASSNWQHLVYKSQSYGVEVYSHDINFVTWGDDAYFSGGLLTDGQWHHYTLTASGGNSRKLYVDGVLMATNTTAYTTDQGTQDLIVGPGSSSNAFSMDELRIWKYARSAAEISANYNQSITCRGDSLVLYMPFEDGTAGGTNTSDTIAYDYSVFANDGRVNNFAKTGSASNWVTGNSRTWYQDSDNDGWGNPSVTTTSCVQPAGYIARGGDCNDANAAVNPGATEICGNSVDDDCDGNTDIEVNKALSFDGTDDNVTLPALAFQSTLTVEAWIKTSTTTGTQQIVSWSGTNNAQLFLSSGKPAYYENGGGYTTGFGSSIADGTWHHIALVRNGTGTSNVQLFVDGALRNTVSFPTTVPNTSTVGIGSYGGASGFFNGSIDEVRIWSTARTQAQLQTYMNRRLDGNETGLLREYSFDQGTAGSNNAGNTDVKDRSSNAANGTLTGFALTGSSSNWVASQSYPTLYTDADGDGWGSSTAATWTCGSMSTFVTNSRDCNDANSAVSPSATEICGNGIDDDCDGNTDLEVNKALSFDGTNDYISVPALAFQATITVEAWVKTSATSGVQQIVIWSGSGNAQLRLNNGAPSYLENGGGYNFSGSVADGAWHHIAIVRTSASSNNLQLFVDGTLNSTVTFAGTVPTSSSLYIGANGNSSSQFFNGSIDEVRIWSTARTQAQLQAYMNRRLDGTETGLLREYSFDQGVAGGTNSFLTTVKDRTANAADGTLNNFALTGSSSNWVSSRSYPALYADADGDGWGNSASTWTCGSMSAFLTTSGDCDDNNAARRPDKVEFTGNNIDDNCNGSTNETINLALNFDGSDDQITIKHSSNLMLGNDFTIEFWMKMAASSANWQNLIYKANSYGVAIYGTQMNLITWNDDAAWTGVVNTDGQWHHYALTASGGSTRKVYRDGVQVSTTNTAAYVTDQGTDDMAFGPGSNSNAFSMDEVRIWNVERTQAEIRQTMNYRLTGSETNLNAYYSFDHPVATAGGASNGTYTTLYDNSLKYNTGTLSNFGLSSATSNWVSGVPYVRENASSRYVWTGLTSTAWNIASNWSPRVVPTSSDTVLLASGTFPANEPTVNASSTASTLSLETGRTLTLGSGFTLTTSGDVTNKGTIKGTGTLAMPTTGTLTNSAGGVIAPGNSPGIMTINGNVALNDGAMNMEVWGTGAAGNTTNGYDKLVVNGDFTGTGILNVDFGSFTPSGGNSWNIVAATGTQTGSFSTINEAPASSPTAYYSTSTGVLSIPVPLNLSLLRLSGQRGPGGVPQLLWQTADEKDMAAFYIQRTAHGTDFSDVGSVAARNGNSAQSYTYNDVGAPSGTIYYRLRIAGLDGSNTFSKVIKLSDAAGPSVKLHPNPVHKGEVLQTEIAASDVNDWKLVNDIGQTVRSGNRSNAPAGELIIPTADLMPGIYLLHLQIAGTTVTQKVTIE